MDYILARFRVGSDGNAADAGSETRLLEEGQHSSGHKGGGLELGSRKARLCASLGDDSGYLVAQQEDSYKGKIIRLDVNQVPQAIAGDARVFARPGSVGCPANRWARKSWGPFALRCSRGLVPHERASE